jgi:mannitol/fructose-specific phosphotransferase system IIA component (Ntr-type)
MELSDFLSEQSVVVLNGSTKAEALDALGALAAKQAGLDAETVRAAIWAREELMSTGIGNGLAIPHVRLAGLDKPHMVVGISRDGIADYQSMDNQPIRIIVLILAPQGQHEAHIRLLAKVADVLKNEALCGRIIAAATPADAHAVLVGAKM